MKRDHKKDANTEISDAELRQLDARPGLYWILVIGGLGINWLGGYARFRSRYSVFSRTVLLETFLLLLVSVTISAVIGRRNWRYALLLFVCVSLGVAGFFFIGAR
jgi:hypothetical protein